VIAPLTINDDILDGVVGYDKVKDDDADDGDDAVL